MRGRMWAAAIALAAPGGAVAPDSKVPLKLIRGQVPLDWRGPDGNSAIFDAPQGLVVIDTGRHPQHVRAILDYARSRGRPVSAVINTHWHLDHTTGNKEVREAFPGARVYATAAVDGALRGFLNRGKERAEKAIADPATPAGERAQLVRGRFVVDHPKWLRATVPVTRDTSARIAGRRFDLRIARFAATEADLWIYDPASRTVVAGDLVVGIVPFMDTACPDGWRNALDEIARLPFRALVPGHGDPMDRGSFLRWRSAFNRFLYCGRSDLPGERCVAGWMSDAEPFIEASHRQYVKDAASYYLTTRLRAKEPDKSRYCRPL